MPVGFTVGVDVGRPQLPVKRRYFPFVIDEFNLEAQRFNPGLQESSRWS